MINSILTLANNALLYSGKLTANHARYGFQPVEEVNPKSDEEKSVSTKPQSAEELQGKTSVSKNFEESLANHLKQTGLTGPEATQRIAELTKEANLKVKEVRREQGDYEANRLMASILTRTTGADPDESLSAAVDSFYQEDDLISGNEAKKTLEDLLPVEEVPSEEQILSKTEKSIENTQAKQPTTSDQDDELGTSGQNIFLSVKSAVEELKRLTPDAQTPSTSDYISMVRQLEAQLAAQKASKHSLPSIGTDNPGTLASYEALEAYGGGYSIPETLAAYANTEAASNGGRNYGALAYRPSYPQAGSLLSVTV
ncbi:MAG: hypothetical protein LBE27_06190 [Deltaproteobacteria bacterium]|jgi:hypothetical protein|nr:hypothetical protein [Deltaproteobacteria bacterium]